MFVLNTVQPNVNAQHCIHTPFLGKNKQHAQLIQKYSLILYKIHSALNIKLILGELTCISPVETPVFT